MPSFIDTPLLQNTPNRRRNRQIRDVVVATGLEFTPVEDVAEAAWRAVTSKDLHHVVGKSARLMRTMAKWAPGYLRPARPADRRGARADRTRTERPGPSPGRCRPHRGQ
jgi:hypothetical protein